MWRWSWQENNTHPGPTRSEGVEKFVQDLAKTKGTDGMKRASLKWFS